MGRKRMLLGTAAVVAVTLVTAGADDVTAKPPRALDGRILDWHGASSLIAGTSQYDSGELVHQDHIYDDLGADTNLRAEQHGNTGAPKGDYRYPDDEDRYGFNAADILEVRFAEDHTGFWTLVRLNTLKVPDSTVVAIGLGIDDTTGSAPWPHGANVRADGVDIVVTTWGTGGTITRLVDDTVTALTDVAVDTDDNAIELRLPPELLGDAPVVRAWVAAGLWDADTSTWMAPPNGTSPLVDARPFNVAFREQETGSYMEEVQAATLATGDITPFAQAIDRRLLRSHATRPYEELGGFHVVILEEGFSIPPHHEGVSYAGQPGRFQGVGGAALSQSFNFYGRHQPYGLFVPPTYGEKSSIPAALVLHGHGGSHVTFNDQPGFRIDMGQGGNGAHEPMFLITPLARGSSFYADWGEADALAVLDDVLTRYPVDRERVYITGYSMGGYGTYRLASLYPDRFAAAAVWAGYTGEFTGAYATSALAPLGADGRRGKAAIGNPVDTLENLRHLPLVHLAGTNDEIVPTPGQYAAPRRLDELGYRSRFDLYPGYEHLTFALVDDWKQARAWLGDHRRESRPREITYKFSDGWTAPGLAAELGLVHDGAWWLRGLTMREPTDDGLTLASAAAVSHGVPGRAHTVERAVTPDPSPTPHTQHEVTWRTGAELPLANRLDLDLVGVGTVVIDVAAAGLTACDLDLRVVSDGPVTITLRGKRDLVLEIDAFDGSLTPAC